MKNITKKWSAQERDQQIEHLLAIDNPEELKSALADVARTAFKAGMMQINVLENTVNPNALNPKLEGKSIARVDLDGAIELGAWKLLPDLYVKHKALC